MISIGCFNPHPARGPSDRVQPGAYVAAFDRPVNVSILTRPVGRVQRPVGRVQRSYDEVMWQGIEWFQSSPGPWASATALWRAEP